MPDTLRDGKGRGFLAGVNEENRLMVVSKSEALQHVLSAEEGQAYQVIGMADLNSGTITSLHVKNVSATKNMVVTYMRWQIVDSAGGTAFPNVSNYFSIALGRKYASGGSEVTPINIHEGSGNQAELVVYQGEPVLSGTAKEIDRWYVKADGDMHVFNKEGAMIISPNNTMELRFIGDQTSGIVYSRISFLMEEVK